MKFKRIRQIISYGLFGVVTFLVGWYFGNKGDSYGVLLLDSLLIVIGYITSISFGIRLAKKMWNIRPGKTNKSNSDSLLDGSKED